MRVASVALLAVPSAIESDRVAHGSAPLTPAFIMDERHESETSEPIPLGQRLFDNVFLLLGLGLLVMFVVFTAWGLWEIWSMPKATLP